MKVGQPRGMLPTCAYFCLKRHCDKHCKTSGVEWFQISETGGNESQRVGEALTLPRLSSGGSNILTYLQFYANNTRELLSSRPCVLYFIGLLGKPNLTWIRLWRYSQAADNKIPFDFIPSPYNKACLGLYFP